MGLNKSEGNMYDFVSHTWNTIKGECYHDCSYCYMKRWGKLNPFRLDEKELKTDLGNGNFIFVGSSCDMFANDVPDEWIEKTMKHMAKFNNRYLLQTKNPNRINTELLPKGTVVCTTIETNRIYPEITRKSPLPKDRTNAMEQISINAFDTFVTVEPIMDFDLKKMVNLIKQCNPTQVNIGADSSPGRNDLPEPSKDKILSLIECLSEFTIVKQKSNLKRLLK